MTTTRTYDTTRRSLAAAKRMPQWQRLITAVHAAQDVAGYEGRQFGPKEMEHFGATLIGKPETKTGKTPADFNCYWVERQSTEGLARYVVKHVRGADLAKVETVQSSEWLELSDEQDERTARAYVMKARELAHSGWSRDRFNETTW